MPEKRYLMTPGPTPAPPQVLAAMAEPVIHHRARDYRDVFETLLGRLSRVFLTENDILLYTSSGTGGMESVVANLCSPGERVVAVSAGYFGERFGEIARAYGCEVEEIRYEWGETPLAEDLAARLAELGGASLVLLTQSETSTGVVADVQALAAVAREAGAVVAVDAISSLGAVPLETDAWGADVVVSGSQKALMTPPGLAAVSVSEEAWSRARGATLPRYYFEWGRVREAQERLDAVFTPAVSLVVALNVALGLLLEEGLEAVFERHVRLGRACREGIKAMGLELFSPDEDRSAVVTAVVAPEGIDSGELVASVRDRFGITLAPGQGPLKGKIFRIGHIGYYDIFDITTALAGVELFSPDEDRSAVVTAVVAPEGIDSGELVASVRDRFGITLAPGQGPLKGKIFRIGHIGYYDIFDITTALAGVELALGEAGADIERGVAVTRALEVFEHTTV